MDPSVVGAPWAEFRRGLLGLGKYPGNTSRGDERIDHYDIKMWEQTQRRHVEFGVWEVYGAADKRIAIGRIFSGASGYLDGEVLVNELNWLLKKLKEHGIPLSQVSKIRGRHTHPSGASDRFSNGDIATAIDVRSYISRIGLAHAAVEEAIIYTKSTFLGRWRLFKRAFILPPLRERDARSGPLP